jgi:ribosomal protein L17
MLKPSKTFKLSKTAKRMIALMKGATDEQRNQYKRMMIQAELSAGIIVKSAPRDKNAPRNGGYSTTSNSATPSAE